MKNIALLFLSIVISFISIFGQEKNVISTKRNLMGLNIGATTGIGMSFKHWHNNIGIQITGLPYKIDDDLDFSVGFMGLYSIKKRKNINFFGYAGFNYMTNGFDFIYDVPILSEDTGIKHKNKEYYNSNTHTYIYEYNNADYFNISGGVGLELGKNPLFTAMIGYAGFDLTEDYKLFPTIELGLHFKLKK